MAGMTNSGSVLPLKEASLPAIHRARGGRRNSQLEKLRWFYLSQGRTYTVRSERGWFAWDQNVVVAIFASLGDCQIVSFQCVAK